jgi:AcrR family transcriptional regulator
MNTTAATTKRRSYRLGARAETMQATRDRILDAVDEAMRTSWYDELTFADLARAAGVSAPTLTNHFGDKHGLIVAYMRERMSAEVSSLRYSIEPGDIGGALRVVLEDYEQTGDMIVRALALEHRFPEMTPLLDEGRAQHRAWVTWAFEPHLPKGAAARKAAVTRLVLCTDVYAWQLLRRDLHHSPKATREHLTATANAVVMSLEEKTA